ASANALTIDLPSPRLPPVTTATLPVRSNRSAVPTRSPLRLCELTRLPATAGGTGKGLRDRHPLLRERSVGLHRGVVEVPALRDHETEVERRAGHAIGGVVALPRPRRPVGRIELHPNITFGDRAVVQRVGEPARAH